MSPMKRQVFHADELVKVESRQRWYVCTGCYAVIDLGPDPEPHSKAPKCERCGDWGAPCNPDRDPRDSRREEPS